MPRAHPGDYLTVYQPGGTADTAAGPLEQYQRHHVQLIHTLLQVMPADALIAHHNQHGWPDLTTPPPAVSANQRLERELQARDWGDAQRAELRELWRLHYGDAPPPIG
jgi:hypothetical protein